MIERTLVLLKPDAVQRALVGEIISRFERAGLKIVGMKMVWADEAMAKKHYSEEIAKKHGERIRQQCIDFLRAGPVVAIALEGIEAIEVVRKIVGPTEPKSAMPGTIRGDYAHVCLKYADLRDRSTPNVIHASSSKQDAKAELELWFSPKELHTYRNVHDIHTRLE
ncbi:MAG: nucleoside-diphosphate kinase [Candidatus Woesearchaeota archaeon]